MNKKIINVILILVILTAVGIGFYFGNQKFSFLESVFNRASQEAISSPSPIIEESQISWPESTTSSVAEQASPEKLTNPIPEVKTITLKVKGVTSQEIMVEKPLTVDEIKIKVDEISKKVDILKLEVAKYNAEKQLEEIRISQIQNQIKDIKTKIDTLTKEASNLSTIDSTTVQPTISVNYNIVLAPIIQLPSIL